MNGVRVWSLYVPNGRGLDDPHYVYKLDWLDKLRQYTSDTLAAHPDLPLALTVTSTSPHRRRQRRPHRRRGRDHPRLPVSPPEREAFRAFEAAG